MPREQGAQCAVNRANLLATTTSEAQNNWIQAGSRVGPMRMEQVGATRRAFYAMLPGIRGRRESTLAHLWRQAVEEEVEVELYEAIRNVQGEVPVNLTPEVTFTELGISSIELVSVIYQLENRWSLSIADNRLAELKTIADARDLIVGMLRAERGVLEAG
jgi:acyl carrier protein